MSNETIWELWQREACVSLKEFLNRRNADGSYVFSFVFRTMHEACLDLDWRRLWETCPLVLDILRLLGQLGGFDMVLRAIALHAADRACRVHVPSALCAIGLDSAAARLSAEPELTDVGAAQFWFRELNALAERMREMLVANEKETASTPRSFPLEAGHPVVALMDMRAAIYAASSVIDAAKESIFVVSNIADVVTSAVWAVMADSAAAGRAAAVSSCRAAADVGVEAALWSAKDAGRAEDDYMSAAIRARVSWADVAARLVSLGG